MPAPTTDEILALRRLGRPADERWVEWAVELLVQGHDSPTLPILAGESSPFDTLEMQQLVDRVVEELGLTPFEDDRDAGISLATTIVRQILDQDVSRELGLGQLRALSIVLDLFDELSDFERAYDALQELHECGEQWYWPGADEHMIHGIIDECCRDWLAAHPDRP